MSTHLIEYPFYREVAASEKLFTILDDKGIPTPAGSDGQCSMPFWSSEEKAHAFIQQNSGYSDFKTYSVEWSAFCEKWFEGLVKDDLLVGLNWQLADGDNCVTEPEILIREVLNCLKAKPINK
ncbi:DUF2750 domain-containing protein [Catenovulum sediminis]|uniref:DUF2750 domain-containing protein n=1 Tax=Catenovulum sediminis TaxID=1740262 RepID=UPI001180EF87|nr:DUF2750 domain-containing protein [Catenovulum sediminis]